MDLTALLATPDYTGLSDADALAKASVPILTPRQGAITATKLFAILGVAGFAVYKTLSDLQNSPDPDLAGFALGTIAVLNSDGFDATNPTALTVEGTMVAAKVCTQDQATLIFNTISYPTGDAPPTLDDIFTARATMKWNAAYASLYAAIDAPWNKENDLRNARYRKLGAMQASKADAPADVVAVDALPDVLVP